MTTESSKKTYLRISRLLTAFSRDNNEELKRRGRVKSKKSSQRRK